MESSYEQEVSDERLELSKQLPYNVGAAISYYAYEHGHYAGEYEVNIIYVQLAKEILSALRRDGLVKSDIRRDVLVE